MTLNKSVRAKGIKNNEIKKRLGEICCLCGCDNPLVLTIDHKIPTIRGGEDVDSNKQVACIDCNWLKGGLTNAEFKKYIKALSTLKELNKLRYTTNEKGDRVIYFNHFGRPYDKQIIKNNDEQIKNNQISGSSNTSKNHIKENSLH